MFAYQTPRSTGGGGDIRSYHLVRMAVELFDVTLVISGGFTERVICLLILQLAVKK